MRYVVILAGGAGTRLWPLSRQGKPKQLLPLFGDKSLLRISYERLVGLIPNERILVCTGADHLGLVRAQLPELPEQNLLGEPTGRDSLNAVAWSAATLADRDRDAVVAMVSADHLIKPVDIFQDSLAHSFDIAEREPRALVLLGVVPTQPHTGFGYLHRGLSIPGFGACRVSEFKEKPELALAQQYLDSEEYWWNSGMGVWRAETILDQIARLAPETYAGVQKIVANPALITKIYPTLPKTSIDYAVLEKVAGDGHDAFVAAVPLKVSWQDVGSFAALAAAFQADADDNRNSGPSVSLDSSGCLIINTVGQQHAVATLGLRDVVVVVTSDAVLVANLHDTERVKELVNLVQDKFGTSHG